MEEKEEELKTCSSGKWSTGAPFCKLSGLQSDCPFYEVLSLT